MVVGLDDVVVTAAPPEPEPAELSEDPESEDPREELEPPLPPPHAVSDAARRTPASALAPRTRDREVRPLIISVPPFREADD